MNASFQKVEFAKIKEIVERESGPEVFDHSAQQTHGHNPRRGSMSEGKVRISYQNNHSPRKVLSSWLRKNCASG